MSRCHPGRTVPPPLAVVGELPHFDAPQYAWAILRVSPLIKIRLAGREGFEPSRELYTPYPLSRRVLSTTQPPPRGVRAVARFYPPRPTSITRCTTSTPFHT